MSWREFHSLPITRVKSPNWITCLRETMQTRATAKNWPVRLTTNSIICRTLTWVWRQNFDLGVHLLSMSLRILSRSYPNKNLNSNRITWTPNILKGKTSSLRGELQYSWPKSNIENPSRSKILAALCTCKRILRRIFRSLLSTSIWSQMRIILNQHNLRLTTRSTIHSGTQMLTEKAIVEERWRSIWIKMR